MRLRNKIAVTLCSTVIIAASLMPSASATLPTTYFLNGGNGTVGVSKVCDTSWSRLPAGQNTEDYFGWNTACGIVYAAQSCVDLWYNDGSLGWTFWGRAETSASEPGLQLQEGYNWKFALHATIHCP